MHRGHPVCLQPHEYAFRGSRPWHWGISRIRPHHFVKTFLRIRRNCPSRCLLTHKRVWPVGRFPTSVSAQPAEEGHISCMDRARTRAALREAEKTIADSRRSIRRQREIITFLASGGHDTTTAEAQLANLERVHLTHIDVRTHILREIRAAKAAKADASLNSATPNRQIHSRRVRRTPYGVR